ncbi:MAG TPA: oligoendopeptidase F [Opitutus sp.]|nr:oligoendopeptidase F [Opitutus sp.]
MRKLPSALLAAIAGSLLTTALPAADAGTAASQDPANSWDLSLIYKDPAAWTAAKDDLVARLPQLKAYEGHLGDSAPKLREALDLLFGLRKDYSRLSTYASLSFDANTRDSAALERQQEIGLAGSQLSEAASFVTPEILAVGAGKIHAFLAAEPGLAEYRFPLGEILRGAPHTLGAEAEGVLAATDLITGTPDSFYSILTAADMPWPTIKLADGTEARLDPAGYSKWRGTANRADREAVFRAFWRTFHDYERTLGTALFSQVKTDWFNAKVRHYHSSLAAALDANDVPESVYRTLVSETNANLPTLHRYLQLRGRLLGIKDLHYWDIYPPIVSLDKDFPLAQAKQLVIDAVAPLGPDYVDLISACLAGRYTDYFPAPGKRSGAYMNPGAYAVHPFVLMNYVDDYESVSTIAHEWGHGMHSMLANHTQPYPTADYPIFTAEIASTTNEALLLEHMLKVARTDEEKLFYLGSALENLRLTFFRQAMFAEFELAIHEVVEHGGALSADKLDQMYGDILRRYHGDKEGVMRIDDFVAVEWAYIPHFYYDFYVYQYATSIAAGQTFATRILNGEPDAREKYLTVLRSGGSDHPYDIVKRAGVDLATPTPYEALFARMNSIMDRIEVILAKQKK